MTIWLLRFEGLSAKKNYSKVPNNRGVLISRAGSEGGGREKNKQDGGIYFGL